MDTSSIVDFVSSLIEIRSPSAQEDEVLEFLDRTFRQKKWNVEKLPVEGSRYNLFITFGKPIICLTTHVDIVAAPEPMFSPQVRDGKLYGRGACDAKGIIGCMVAAAERLEKSGETNFSLLFVVGEEDDGIGANRAAISLKGRGIRYIIDGEPTEGKLMAAHKGGLAFRMRFRGKSCHSGYPHLGDDANAKLIRTAASLLTTDFGADEVLGKATINIGRIQAGTGDNIVSNVAQMSGMVRTVTDNKLVIDKLKKVGGADAELDILNDAALVRLKLVPGMQSDVAAYCTDIPHFAPLGAECLLYGPGTISVAHTDHEHVEIQQLEDAVKGYEHIFHELKKETV